MNLILRGKSNNKINRCIFVFACKMKPKLHKIICNDMYVYV